MGDAAEAAENESDAADEANDNEDEEEEENDEEDQATPAAQPTPSEAEAEAEADEKGGSVAEPSRPSSSHSLALKSHKRSASVISDASRTGSNRSGMGRKKRR